jgi:hypothetical protein
LSYPDFGKQHHRQDSTLQSLMGVNQPSRQHLGTHEALDWGQGGEACRYLPRAKESKPSSDITTPNGNP